MASIELRPVRVKARLEGEVVEAEGRWGNMRVGEPPEMGGREDLPSPLDLLVASLVTCEAFMARMVASKLGLNLKGVEVEAEGSFGVGEGLRSVSISFRLSGVGEEEARRIVEMVRSLCPIYNTIARAGARIEEKITVS